LFAQIPQYCEPRLYSTQHGLSSTKTAAIEEDDKGYIWIATENGLNRFDGYHFKTYKNIEGDSLSLLNNHVSSLLYDSENQLWVATMTGLQRYNPIWDCFINEYLGFPPEIVGNKSVISLMEDSNKNIWFAVNETGIIRYSLKTKQSRLFKPIDNNNSLRSRQIRVIEEDDEGNIWFGSMDNGISIYSPETDSFTNYNSENSNLSGNEIIDICRISNGNMLISIIGKGLFLYDAKKKIFEPKGKITTAFCLERINNDKILIGTEGEGLFYMDALNLEIKPYSDFSYPIIKDNKIHAFLEDKNNNLWMVVFNEGICFLRKEPDGFRNFKRISYNSNSLSAGQVTSIALDKDDNCWFATDGGGLNFYNNKSGKYTHYINNKQNSGSISDNAVVSVFCDSKGVVWAGTYFGGLCKLNRQTGQFTIYRHNEKTNSLSGNYVKCIVEDSQNRLWVGTDGKGVNLFNPETEKFENFSTQQFPDLISDNTTFLYLENDEMLWIGTYSGLSSYDINKKIFKSYGKDESLKNESVYTIIEDENHDLWVGTSFGLKKYDRKNDSFRIFRAPNELNSPQPIYSIVPHKGNLWLATDNGIVCYNPDKQSIIYYINNNDLGSTNFIRSSFFKSDKNEIFFGGSNGVYAFYPDKMILDKYAPKVYITDLKIFNKLVTVGKKYNGLTILEKSLDKTEKISFKYSQNNFTIEFSAPNNLYPYSITYYYFMEGADKELVALPFGQQSVNYVNLPPGNYKFSVAATNISGIDALDATSIQIEILPPIWQTWYAKFAYAILILIIVTIIFLTVESRIKDKNKLKMQEEISESKMRFFTNVSHEFRTPLALIITPLEEMQNVEISPERAQINEIILRNAKRLQQLINQILDLRKMEKSSFEVRARLIDLPVFLKGIIELFEYIVKRKNLTLNCECCSDNITVWYDPDLLEKCLYNLLSNAIKFTPEQGKITVSVNGNSNEEILLSISDTGRGIDKEDIPKLFNRFYQGAEVDNSGYGIGLHLVKTIIEQHHGKIDIESEKMSGSRFTIHILNGNSHFNPNEIVNTPWKPEEKQEISRQNEEKINEKPEEKQTILLVEDDYDMCDYITYELKNNYVVISAKNGKEAIYRLRSVKPDIIITDVMMPEIDGIELCRIVKANIETCHIPIIILSVKDGMESRLAGFETGADCYVTKPFNMSFLKLQIKKLLDRHEKIRRKHIDNPDFNAQIKDIDDRDEILLQKTVKTIRENLSDTGLSVDSLAKTLNVSRTNFHRKIKSMTGLNPIEIIKTIRMKQAAYLLDQKKLTISEVAYEVGYNSLSYFSSSFNSYWGVTPTAYVNKQTEHSEKEITE
jgi:signal transduction histidine kinase/ligand-binding sensor domain-containing protein/DNA-binding response OmpR family regulator